MELQVCLHNNQLVPLVLVNEVSNFLQMAIYGKPQQLLDFWQSCKGNRPYRAGGKLGRQLRQRGWLTASNQVDPRIRPIVANALFIKEDAAGQSLVLRSPIARGEGITHGEAYLPKPLPVRLLGGVCLTFVALTLLAGLLFALMLLTDSSADTFYGVPVCTILAGSVTLFALLFAASAFLYHLTGKPPYRSTTPKNR